MTFHKIFGFVHRWLGLISGLVVFVIAITGCIYAFQEEIRELTEDYRFVEPRREAMLPPSELQARADAALPGKHIHALLYRGEARSAQAIYYSADPYYYDIVYLNPYSGEVIRVKDMLSDFFTFILDGHFYFWLPHEIGQPFVATATLIFVVMLISGMILWWPRNKAARKQRFSVKWNARWRRKNYDLHTVAGFYIFAVALLLALTGLVWGFTWFRDGLYTVASGGDEYVQYYEPASTPADLSASVPAIDRVWHRMVAEYPGSEWIEVHVPHDEEHAIAANANPDPDTYWQLDFRYFDQGTLEELKVDHIYGRFEEAGATDKLFRMNYDIHTGGILGLPGKIIMFLASLVVASLPVTGFMVWWGRRKKAKVAVLQENYARSGTRERSKVPA